MSIQQAIGILGLLLILPGEAWWTERLAAFYEYVTAEKKYAAMADEIKALNQRAEHVLVADRWGAPPPSYRLYTSSGAPTALSTSYTNINYVSGDGH